MLVIGAGTGNDVAIALSKGAQHVDAVEIDPRVLQTRARQRIPDRPYSDPRVTAHVDDGRAFLERTDEQYDLILFALPDSLDARQRAVGAAAGELPVHRGRRWSRARSPRRRAAPSRCTTTTGALADRPLRQHRAAGVRARAVRATRSATASAQAVLTRARRRTSTGGCATTWDARGRRRSTPSTDDRPFPYLRHRHDPVVLPVALALILLASLVLVRVAAGPLRQMRPYADLFFMGAAFLLLETKNVVQFALLFGTTWFVNAARVRRRAARRAGRGRGGPAGAHRRRPVLLYAALLGGAGAGLVGPRRRCCSSCRSVPRFLVGVTDRVPADLRWRT